MTANIRRIEYFYTTVKDEPGRAFDLLSRLAFAGVNLVAFSAVPVGPASTQLVLFPEQPEFLTRFAKEAGLTMTGPQPVFLVQGDDELGALCEIHKRLSDADINVFKSEGVADGRGGYGYLIYVRQGDYEDAARALGV